MVRRIRCGKNSWRIMGIYINRNMEEKLEGSSEGMDERKREE